MRVPHLSTWDFQHDAKEGLSHLKIFNMKEDQGLSHLQVEEGLRRKQGELQENQPILFLSFSIFLFILT